MSDPRRPTQRTSPQYPADEAARPRPGRKQLSRVAELVRAERRSLTDRGRTDGEFTV